MSEKNYEQDFFMAVVSDASCYSVGVFIVVVQTEPT